MYVFFYCYGKVNTCKFNKIISTTSHFYAVLAVVDADTVNKIKKCFNYMLSNRYCIITCLKITSNPFSLNAKIPTARKRHMGYSSVC